MRLAKKWAIGGTVAVGALGAAAAAAVPAIAQQPGGQHHPPAVHVVPVCAVSGVPQFTPGTATPVSGVPVIVGPAGKTVAPPVTVRVVPVPGKPDGPFIMAAGKPLKLKPVVDCSADTTGLPPSTTTYKPLR